MIRISSRPALGSLVVAAAVALSLTLPAQLAVSGSATAAIGAAAAMSHGGRIPVNGQLLVCPDLRSGPADSSISLTVPTASSNVAVSKVAVSIDAGALGTDPVGTAGPGLTVLAAPKAPVPVIVRSRGLGAAGVVAGRRTLALDGSQRGLSVFACPAAERETWFVGSGSSIGRRGQLVLINPTPAAVVVDVDLSGPDGPLRAPAGRGVTIASGASVVLKLDALVPDVAVFGVHVAARTGRVVAALRDEESFGITQPAVDWVPAAAAPARTASFPGWCSCRRAMGSAGCTCSCRVRPMP